eukprot:TRINITY_DN2708_c1_g2_i4.p1 TRINITY_DN2708_c1_g2~~TRINITY_DN2708_c1_g2_i4.p1  ORF type:complete len:141 (-),score=8.59 TRINITY_DN2708_c1_g2_i4:8-430(-)
MLAYPGVPRAWRCKPYKQSQWPDQYDSAKHVTMRTPAAYLPGRLPGGSQGILILERASRLDAFSGLSLPHIATLRCMRPHNRYTSGASTPVLSYQEQPSSVFLRPQQIETELSHDVLNPARVPLQLANSQTLGTFSSPRM